MGGIGDGMGSAIVILCIACVAVFFGGWELIDYFFIDDAIKTTQPIIPKIEIIVKDNVIDTLYVYREPKN